MAKRWIIYAVLAIVLLFTTLVPVTTSLAVYGENGSLLYTFTVQPSQEIIISYEHSIHRSPVNEYFTVENNALTLKKIDYVHTSVGMPSEAPLNGVWKTKDGVYIVEGINTIHERLLLLVDQVSANYRVTVGEEEIILHELARGGSIVKITVERCSLYQWVERRIT